MSFFYFEIKQNLAYYLDHYLETQKAGRCVQSGYQNCEIFNARKDLKKSSNTINSKMQRRKKKFFISYSEQGSDDYDND